MKILVGHNYYQQPGGEDHLFRVEVKLLRSLGHDVHVYERRNDEIGTGFLSRLRHALSLRWSKRSYNDIRALIKSFKPDVAHFHNTFFVITPSAFYACRDAGIPVIVSLHNFRLMCINGLFFRDNHPCEDCTKGSRMKGIVHKCYRGSLLFSAALSDMVQFHWDKQTWTTCVRCFIVSTEFSRRKHIQAGIPPEKIIVLPNFVEDPGMASQGKGQKTYALYAGRLSQEKGLDVLLKSWKGIKDIPLYIVGNGPLRSQLERQIQREGLDNVKMLGFLDKEDYLKLFCEAMFLVAPCLSYDNFPMVIVEAYSYGVPVIASRLGSLEEAVEDNVTGLLFAPGDAADLTLKVRQMTGNEQQYRQMCLNARNAYDLKYTPQQHYQGLMGIYS